MTSIAAQQVALDNALAAPENRVQIGKCNMRIDPTKTPKEPTYQVVFDSLALSPLYPAFLINVKICPRLPNQEFDALPSDEEIVSFIKELGHKGDIKSVTDVAVDQMQQPWRTFASIINKCLSRKIIATTPKKARKFKKPASPLKKKDLVAAKEPGEKPMKKPAARRQSAGVQIRDTPGMSVSKKKAPTKAERSKGIELLSEATSLEEAQLKRAIKRSKRETNIHQPSGSSEGADLESEVCDEPKGKSIDTSKGTGLKPGVPDLSRADSFKSEYESWRDSDDDDDQQSGDESTEFDDDKSADLNKTDDEVEDEFIHTPDNYVPTDDENVDDKEYERINKEMYDDVNVELKDVEPANEEKGDEEMTHSENVNAEYEEVSQEVAGETEIISMMDIKVQHEDPSIQTSPLLTVPVTVIPKSLTALATTIPPPILPFIPLPQQSTPIPTPTTTEATISTTSTLDSSTLTAFHQRLSDLENEVKTLRNFDHSLAIRASIKSEVPTVVKEYFGTNLDNTLHKVIQRHIAKLIKEYSIEHAAKQQESQYTIKSFDKAALKEFDQKRALFKTVTASNTFNKHPKHKALYHALMKSILANEDAMDKGVADIQKKKKLDDADRDEDPPAGGTKG
ncbi:hypothetical protein Tco_1517742 [Tanacetum coccineum]